MSRYVVVSPVRNEEEYARHTLISMVEQTLRPVQWVIVDDGSTDQTAAIVRDFATKHDWIKLISLADRGYYFPGTGVVEVFNQGLVAIDSPDWTHVVKLDMDLSFPPTYFELLMQKFKEDPKLGVASGLTVTLVNGVWTPDKVQPDHPVGPSKVYRRACFEAMGGLLPVPGWDLADTLGAQMHAWTTRVFPDLKVNHYRVSGVRRGGAWKRSLLQGSFEYRHGYRFFYTLIKALRNIAQPPKVIGGIGRIVGFILAAWRRDVYLFPADMRAYLRQKQLRILLKFGRRVDV